METVRELLREIDYQWITAATEWTAATPWHTAVVYVAAELLIFLFPLVLLYLWEQPPRLRTDRYGAKKAVVMALMSLVVGLAFKALISFILFRDRPFVSHNELSFLDFHVDASSFPSSHAMISFALASSLYLSGYRKRGFWLLVAALVIAIGRVCAGVHYPSDVLAGALIGLFSAWYIHSEASSLRRYLPDK